MSIAVGATKDTVKLVINEPILILGALCFVVFAAISSLFGSILIIGPFISIILISVSLVGYTTMIDTAITRKASPNAFIHGVSKYWGQAIKAYLSITGGFLVALIIIRVASESILPIPSFNTAIDLIINPTLAPIQLFLVVFIIAYLPVFLLLVVQTLVCATIVIENTTALTAIKNSTSMIFVTPLSVLTYILLRFGALSIAAVLGAVVSPLGIIGAQLFVAVVYAISEIYTVCYYRRRKEYLEHTRSSEESGTYTQSTEIKTS